MRGPRPGDLNFCGELTAECFKLGDITALVCYFALLFLFIVFVFFYPGWGYASESGGGIYVWSAV